MTDKHPTIAAALEGRESLQPLPDVGSETQDGDVIIPGAHYRALLSRANTAERELAEAREWVDRLRRMAIKGHGPPPFARRGQRPSR